MLNDNFRTALDLYSDRFSDALLLTLQITVGAVLIGMAFGLVLALARLSSLKPLARLSQGMIVVVRAIPVPPFLYLVYFAYNSEFSPIEPETAGTLALGILLSPVMAELFRSGIQSVNTGYIEAGLAMGMSSTLVHRRIIIPIALRIMLPPIGQLIIGTLLNSAFVAILGGKELTGMARKIIHAHFTTELYFVLAATYFLIAYPMSRILAYLERRIGMKL